MTHSWTAAQQGNFRDAYLDWSRVLKTRRDALPPAQAQKGTAYEPIFIRLTGQNMAAQRALLKAEVDNSASVLLMDAHELAFLNARISNPSHLSALPDEYAAYRKLGTGDAAFANLFEVLDTGVPVFTTQTTAPQPATIAPMSAGDGPIMAIIDDGIGFLNARFRKSGTPDTSRFGAIWLQALEQIAPQTGAVCGEVLTAADINALLAKGSALDETAAYSDINARLYGNARRSSDFSSSHGTHILDMAAGADPADSGDPVRDWPLLGVQLPPEAIEDTSGTRFESYVIQGMRWILQSARHMDKDAPVVVNISLGVLAGPKDGSRFLEYQVAREAAQWEAATGQRVRIVWSFGNSYLGRQVAQFAFAGSSGGTKETNGIDLRVQPEDQTASYVEIHGIDVAVSKLRINVIAPDGTKSGYKNLKPGELRSLTRTDGKALARLYHVPERDFGTGTKCPAHYVLALAPTAQQKAGEPTAPCGAWHIDVRYGSADAAAVSIQVQRDDGRGTYGGQARQAYLDHPDAFEWSDTRHAYLDLGNDCPITHAATHTSMVTSPARQIYSAGAAINDGPMPSPARYSAAGSDWSVDGPTASTIADDGHILSGVLGAGTLSGTIRAQNGTSVAAGKLSRALGLSAATIVANASQGGHLLDFDSNALTLTAINPDNTARLGAFLVETHRGSLTR